MSKRQTASSIAIVPLFRWVGSKRRIATQIVDTMLADGSKPRRYMEPFVGSGAVYLELKTRNISGPVLLSDSNQALIECYRSVRDQPRQVWKHLRKYPSVLGGTPPNAWRDVYYEVRDAHNASGPVPGPLGAARFLWLRATCFNGLWRENRAGKNNVPIGRTSTGNAPAFTRPSQIRAISHALRDTILCVGDFRRALEQAKSGDLIYCDPPYPGRFSSYTAGGFRGGLHLALAQACLSATSRGARVYVSLPDAEITRELYPPEIWTGYGGPKTTIRCAVSGRNSGRKMMVEMLLSPRGIIYE